MSVEVRRNGRLLAGVGLAAAAVAVAYLSRALGSGAVGDWLLTGVLSAIAVGHLAALVDARSPLLVADEHGVRLRVRRSWVGLPWSSVARIEHLPPSSWLRDGRLAVVPAGDGADVRPFGVRLGLATRVLGAPQGLDAALQELVPGALAPAPVVALHTEAEDAGGLDSAEGGGPGESGPGASAGRPTRWRDPRPLVASGIGALAARLRPGQTSAPVRGALALDTRTDPEQTEALPELEQLRRPGFDGLDEDFAPVPSEQVRDEPGPAAEPVIGPLLVTARERLGLGLDVLAERTRIRTHVLEAIEVDDFGVCGGDFYARGHLRTLARVLGLDAAPLLAAYDQTYAHAPVSPRQVLEAELVTAGGGEREPRGGLNWSVLLAAVMAVVLAWSLARLVLDGPLPAAQSPRLDGSGGVHGAPAVAGDAVAVVLRAAGGGAHVVVRDARGRIVFTGDLAYGASRSLEVAPPVKIDSSDGSLEVVVDGDDRGRLGEIGHPASATYVPR